MRRTSCRTWPFFLNPHFPDSNEPPISDPRRSGLAVAGTAGEGTAGVESRGPLQRAHAGNGVRQHQSQPAHPVFQSRHHLRRRGSRCAGDLPGFPRAGRERLDPESGDGTGGLCLRLGRAALLLGRGNHAPAHQGRQLTGSRGLLACHAGASRRNLRQSQRSRSHRCERRATPEHQRSLRHPFADPHGRAV